MYLLILALVLWSSPAFADTSVLERVSELRSSAREEGSRLLTIILEEVPKDSFPLKFRPMKEDALKYYDIAGGLDIVVDFLVRVDEAYQDIDAISENEEKNFYKKRHWFRRVYSKKFQMAIYQLKRPGEKVADVITRIHNLNLSGMNGLVEITDFRLAADFYSKVLEACK